MFLSVPTAVRRACSGLASSDLSLTQRYDHLVSRESLQRDTNQLRVIEHLEELRMNLCDYHPTEPGLLQRVREIVCHFGAFNVFGVTHRLIQITEYYLQNPL